MLGVLVTLTNTHGCKLSNVSEQMHKISNHAEHVAQYVAEKIKGDRITFDRKLLSNGYEWISQPRAGGGFWYIPIRELKDSTYWGEDFSNSCFKLFVC